MYRICIQGLVVNHGRVEKTRRAGFGAFHLLDHDDKHDHGKLMGVLQRLNIRNVVLISIALRIILIFYSEWHDRHSTVKYTDIDYVVFTDAARYLWDPLHDHKPDSVAQGPLGRWMGLGK